MRPDEPVPGAVPPPFKPSDDWDPRIGEIHDYWRRLHDRVEAAPAKVQLPGRQHLDPLEIPALLPWVRLFDVAHNPFRLRYRLIGTAESVVYGDHTGRWLHEVYPHFEKTAVCRDYLSVVDYRQPSYYRGKPRLGQNLDIESTERLVLPLARDGRRVDMLLALFIHTPKPTRR